MRNNIRSTNLRFNLDKDLQRKAWQYLQTMDKGTFKSYSNAIALSVCDYFERYYHRKDDPYFETRQREEQFIGQIVSAVEKAMEKTLPLFLAGLMSGIGQTEAHVPMPSAVSTALTDKQNSDEDVDWDFLGE
ncbi:MAG: adenylate cyclase [Lachnospiraceae bacterium]|nr:adenylate cyclase [Lachnospiraceae bacterium]